MKIKSAVYILGIIIAGIGILMITDMDSGIKLVVIGVLLMFFSNLFLGDDI